MLKALPRWARDVLLLVAEGLPFARIAVLRGMPHGTAATRIRHARALFAALLAKSERSAMCRLTRAEARLCGQDLAAPRR